MLTYTEHNLKKKEISSLLVVRFAKDRYLKYYVYLFTLCFF